MVPVMRDLPHSPFASTLEDRTETRLMSTAIRRSEYGESIRRSRFPVSVDAALRTDAHYRAAGPFGASRLDVRVAFRTLRVLTDDPVCGCIIEIVG
ncbi:hypothetical protein EYF80_048313 [Liparis tanakae]|uniref:Uncharacterized protein n=1 Tax=Liparis tanakae TaxID=230148 RepID=A0A4Z2FJV6_9TELE|nr:hypothetical protein EYF80_048313 [Liparis tanakae]